MVARRVGSSLGKNYTRVHRRETPLNSSVGVAPAQRTPCIHETIGRPTAGRARRKLRPGSVNAWVASAGRLRRCVRPAERAVDGDEPRLRLGTPERTLVLALEQRSFGVEHLEEVRASFHVA